MNTSVTLIVPVKNPSSSKSRLAPVLGPIKRRALSLMLLDHVLTCAASASMALHIWVVGGNEAVRSLATERGTLWLPEMGTDLNQTLWHAIRRACQEGGDTAFLPADLPFLTAKDVAALVDTLTTQRVVVLCPAQQDGGTNALAMPQALAFPPKLGTDSFARHLEELRRLGHPYTILRRPGLAFDLDTSANLAYCRAHLSDFNSNLACWATALENSSTGMAQST